MAKPNFGIYGSWGIYQHYKKASPLKPWMLFVNGHGGGYPNESNIIDDNGVGLTSPELITQMRPFFSGLCVAYEPTLVQTVKNVDYWWLTDEPELRPNGMAEVNEGMKQTLKFNSAAKFAVTVGGQTGPAWGDPWLDKIKELAGILRVKDILVMNYGYGLDVINHIPEKYKILAELLGKRVKDVVWGVGTPNKADRIPLIWIAYQHAVTLGMFKLLYWDFSPARQDLDMQWFATEGNLNGDPWCLVDYGGNSLPGYNTIDYFNHL